MYFLRLFYAGVFCLVAAGALPAAALTLYVAPDGNDAWSGRLRAADAAGANGPLATLEWARDAARHVRENARRGLDEVEVVVLEGTYLRDKTFELGEADGGSDSLRVVYRADEGAAPRFIGGRLIESFGPVQDEAVRARFQEAAREQILQVDLKALGITDYGTLKPRGFGRGGQTMAMELFFDGQPMTLARWPNGEEWLNIAGVPDGPEGGKFSYAEDRPGAWAANDDLWVHGYWTWDWADSFTQVAHLDTAAKTITTTEPHGVYGYKEGARYYFLNVLEELDSPGEYYIDRQAGVLYFWPPTPVAGKEAAVSLLETPMVTVENTQHLRIEGLRFEYTRGTVLRLSGGAHNRVSHCTFANIGTDAINLQGGTDNGADGCLLYNLGYGGITVDAGDRMTLTAADNFATNNEIHDFSRAVRTYTPAVQVNGVGNLIAHNLIYNSPHMAIGLGGNDHRIEYNEIHHVCMETHDAGAFYMGRDWTQRGNIVRYNFMHHLGHGDVQAVYLDDWSSGTLVYGNILQGARRGVLNGGGRDNIVENNIFIDCGAAVHIDERGKGWAKNYFNGETPTLFERLEAVKGTEGVYAERYPELATLLEDDPVSAKGNVVRRNISVNSKFLELSDGLTPETPYLTIENNLVDVDPLLVDAAKGDYRLREDSPAYTQIHFQPIPVEKIGPQRGLGILARLSERDPGDEKDQKDFEGREGWVQGDVKVDNLLPPLEDPDDPRTLHEYPPTAFPIADTPVVEHVRVFIEEFPAQEDAPIADKAGVLWTAREEGLYQGEHRHPHYGLEGPLSTEITALAQDSRGNLWIGTPLGLSVRDPEGEWRHIRGKNGLPYENITALAFDAQDRLWIGTTKGAIQYRPYEEGRQWFYRQGQRYLPSDHVLDVAVTPDGKTAYFLTDAGPGAIEERETTLLEKANVIEKLVNERHRRLGLVADAVLDDPWHPTSRTIPDNDNDGLWTAYHVAAMSLAYAVTRDPAHLASAKESMHAMVMLQNASGTPGLVARSVLPPEEGAKKGPQWRPTPDGTMYWKSDTSSDEIDGHYLAFYTYWEHIARYIPEERALILKQIRDLTNYIVDNNYQLIDWDGERTRWGFWNPESLNQGTDHYLEKGLNSLQILSFLKVAHHITGDVKFKEHFDKLILEHGYLNNVLLEKKVFPDENNHSDNQLAYVAWYPWLQLEEDPRVHEAMLKAVRRHYKILSRDKSSFFYLISATIDPDYVKIEDAIENLREIPTDRKQYPQMNSHRADVQFDPYVDRFGELQLMEVLPADERAFDKWNRNLYLADYGRNEHLEDDGAHYLLPYWLARYHGWLAAP